LQFELSKSTPRVGAVNIVATGEAGVNRIPLRFSGLSRRLLDERCGKLNRRVEKDGPPDTLWSPGGKLHE